LAFCLYCSFFVPSRAPTFRLLPQLRPCGQRWALRHDEDTKRCSAHAFADPVEVITFYDGLISTGHDHGVSMPVMESYAAGVRRFAITPHKPTAL